MLGRMVCKKVVYNVEPFEYSYKAVTNWIDSGFTYIKGSWAEVHNKDSFESVTVIIVRLGGMLSEEILRKFPNVECIISATTGQDHLSLNAISKKNAQLITLKGEEEFLRTIPSTAEHTWALLLSLIRNVNAAVNHVRNGGWDRDLFKGFQLKNKKIGIIGLGRIGEMIAKYAKAFDMEVLYFDPYVKNNNFRRMKSLKELMKESDIISIHVHLNNETEKLISNDLLKSVKKGSYLLNTSRGKILDETEVVNSLMRGDLAGVGLDVLSEEINKNIRESELWKAQERYNVIITPHIAGATYDAMWTCEEFVQKKYLNKA
jgi:D-3-phosphoglycerate dehydrogenase / 2-oxoglutarate reductase